MEHLQSGLAIHFEQYSDAGLKPHNQDTIGARIPEGSALSCKGISIAIADGVSSSEAAKQASQAAVTGFLTDYYATPDTWRTKRSAIQVIQSLNRYLCAQGQHLVQQEGHLTTFSVLILKGDTAFVFHVGDSRIYRLRDGNLEQLTRDHTKVIDSKTTYLSRALGADPCLEIDLQTMPLEKGDTFILTTDGIHDAIPSSLFKALALEHQSNLEELINKLSAKALELGSDDNISIQACTVESKGAPSQSGAVAALSKLPFPPILDVGHIIDGLKIKKLMHESERSQVYVVEAKDGTSYVMKTPSVNYEDDPAYIERFVMENWIGSRIHNAHVVRVIEPPQPRTCLYYLTEHIPGPTLAELIKQRAPFDIPDTIELIEQIIKGIRAFHRKDTLHQDLKPENIVIGKSGAIIIDFGSCWVAGVEEIGTPFQRDTILGTMDFSAPEYRFGGQRGPKSDQFSIAVMLYEMLTGRKPYGDAYADAMNIKTFQKLTYISASKHNPLVPVWLDRAIEKATQIQPNARYSALSEWLTDLKRPNPSWTTAREQPLMERNPVLVWQCIAVAGWIAAIVAMAIK